MKILFIAPSTLPGASGVGDYTTALAREVVRQGGEAALVSLQEPEIPGIQNSIQSVEQGLPVLRVRASALWEDKAVALKKFAEEFRPDWASLQFVCYGFDKRGLVPSLGKKLAAVLPDVRWHILFHEIWIGRMVSAPLKQQLLGTAQKYAIRLMLNDLDPALCHTTNPTYSAILKEVGLEASVLPLFGNIPTVEKPSDDVFAQAMIDEGLEPLITSERYLFFALYGTLHPVWPPEPLLSHILKASTRLKKTPVFVSIGSIGAGKALWEEMRNQYEPRIRFIQLGHQPAETIAHHFNALDFGIAASTYQLIGKSSSAAAMLEHGVPLIANRQEFYDLPTDHEKPTDPLVIPMTPDLEDKIVAGLPRRPPHLRLSEITAEFLKGVETASQGKNLARPLKILIISPCFGTYGGIEAFVIAVARHVREQPGFQVRICWKQTKGFSLAHFMRRRCEESGIDYTFVPRGSLKLFWEILRSDVIHLQNASPDVIFYARLAGKPIALTIHNYARIFSPRSWLWRIMSRFADRRWYNSNFVWRTWEWLWKLKTSRRVPTISGLEASPTPFENRRGFCFISRWIPNKGIDILVKAYAAARLDTKRHPLILMGDGPLRRDIEQLIARDRIKGIKLLGFVPEAEKAKIIGSSRWLVAPSNTHEDLGLTPIEARSMAVPCVVTRDGGLPESAGEGAVLCKPGSVDDLARALREAAEMPAGEYERRARLAHESLKSFLLPMSFYTDSYRELARRAHKALA